MPCDKPKLVLTLPPGAYYHADAGLDATPGPRKLAKHAVQLRGGAASWGVCARCHLPS